MKMHLGLILSCLLLGSFSFSQADSHKKVEKSDQKSETTQKSHDFEDMLVQGKYHFSDDVVTTVEEDKVLDALIGIRTDFKDKIENSETQF